MIEKVNILIIILILLLLFYVVIAIGAKKKSGNPPEIKRYLFGVRVLITLLAIVAFVLWLFL
tara:strand:+ start:17 stop:202 length:186 start_codon:yes stop_codon:yes gene_type:complete